MATLPFAQALQERLLVLDGAVGTMLLNHGLREEDFRGEEFAREEPAREGEIGAGDPGAAGTSLRLYGNLDLLTLVRPDLVEAVHRAYINAGAEIITTNTFTANGPMQARYGTAHLAERMNREAAALARRAADDARDAQPEREVYVAGSLGPIAPGPPAAGGNEGARGSEVSGEDMRRAYAEQVRGLAAGGAEVILIETAMSVAGAAAACAGAQDAFARLGRALPVWVSATTDETGARMGSGESFTEFVRAVADFGPVCVGLNCGYGPKSIAEGVRALAEVTDLPIAAYPNAGLPDEQMVFPVGPPAFGRWAEDLAATGLVRVIGGCCGTTPEHIRAVRRGIGTRGDGRQ
ncbi:MAG TPA: homocysteine S-methyltransferase family protein [candidate division Zixibacteria bacterium]|nr:homocysteine S-methyltransferase family protein [candidate division Zixibacteria bacterium]MDD4916207.1 homocysteine S-methyltransferase family protein [candidate division Zixibacteria bacterium]HOD66915.1 homocysteine S-methyltransferase family protein [candidate division Zixibacteria bacterium]HPM37512.1 homocysteine S-methyltransferase family protein [candidate division Zixibacteria bacterium]